MSNINRANVRQTGSIVEEEEIVPRAIYSSSQFIVRNVPNGAKGLILMCRIHSVSGTFDEDEGLSLIAEGRYASTNVFLIGTDRRTSASAARSFNLILHPQLFDGTNFTTLGVSESNAGKFDVSLVDEIRFRFIITGTDPEADASVLLRWVM